MKYDLNIYELGQLLTKITESYKLELLSKLKLSGGWMTITGEVEVVSVPQNKVVLKGNNIITLKIKDIDCKGSLLKITGAKDGIFRVDVSPTKYKELGISGLNLNKTKTNNNETKIRIDEDMIFTVREGAIDSIQNMVNNI